MTSTPSAKALIWLSTLVFALHNLEEALFVEAWAQNTMSDDLARLYTTGPFSLAVILLWLCYVLVVVWFIRAPGGSSRLVFLLGFSAIFANGITHIVANTIVGHSAPGFYTALLLVLPLGLAYFASLVRSQDLSAWTVGGFIAAGALLQMPLAATAIYVSNQVFRILT